LAGSWQVEHAILPEDDKDESRKISSPRVAGVGAASVVAEATARTKVARCSADVLVTGGRKSF
jgi:hypothetical protein